MKYSILTFFLMSIISCSNSSQDYKSTVNENKSKNQLNDFKVLKSGFFWNELEEGKFQIIKFKDFSIDSIDTYFGIHTLKGDALIYLTITKDETDEIRFNKDTIYGSIEKYILFRNKSKESVKNLTKYFDDYFSSPNCIDDKLYFWGIKYNPKIDSISKIYASEFNPLTNKTASIYLFDDDLGTDFRGYFREPYIKNNKIIFESNENQKWTFNKDFELEK
jgi:hypothetical protein